MAQGSIFLLLPPPRAPGEMKEFSSGKKIKGKRENKEKKEEKIKNKKKLEKREKREEKIY